MKYTIEELWGKCYEHAHLYDKQKKEMIKNFKEINPCEPLPEHMNDDFNFPLALKTICEEILNLQRTVAVKDLH